MRDRLRHGASENEKAGNESQKQTQWKPLNAMRVSGM
jgi:hypothetical protein